MSPLKIYNNYIINDFNDKIITTHCPHSHSHTHTHTHIHAHPIINHQQLLVRIVSLLLMIKNIIN